MRESTSFYILPVSGGAFPVQLASLHVLGQCSEQVKPDVVMSSSGGNVAAYLSDAGEWRWNGIEKSVRQIRYDWFSRPWSSFSPIASLYVYAQRTLKNSGTGVSEFIHSNYTSDSIQQTEIWSGTYNISTQRSRLFCNRDQDDCIINPSTSQLLATGMENPMYARGDLDLISDYSVASASIPHIVPPVNIDGDYYADGVLGSASPASLLAGEMENVEGDIHITYINCCDIESYLVPLGDGPFDVVMSTVGTFVKSLTYADRRRCCEVIASRGELKHVNFNIDVNNIDAIQAFIATTKASMFEMYSDIQEMVDIHALRPCEILTLMFKAQQRLKGRVWYVQGEDRRLERKLLQYIQTTI